MKSEPSEDDIEFKDRFEAGVVKPSEFNHRAHLRLAYIYLCDSDTKTANDRMRRSLKKFLADNNVPASKYHETLTCSWVRAVRHFMSRAGSVGSFRDFIAVDDRLLDSNIMLSHYNLDTLFSEQARRSFVPPDVEPIPQHQ